MNPFSVSVVLVSAVFLAVSTIFMALRLVARSFVVRKVTLSDYVMIVGWVIVSLLSAFIFYSAPHGLGVQEGVLPEWREPLAKAQYAFTILYNPALIAIKSSILIFYFTLSRGQPLFRLGTCVTLGIVIVAGLSLTLVNILQCRPVNAVTQVPTPSDAHCIDIVALYIVSAPINIVTDLAIFFLPLRTLWHIRLPRRQKMILLVTFGTGLFVTVISVIRTVYLLRLALSRATKPDPPGIHDLSYYDGYLFLWSAIELNLGIMCGSVPSLKPLVARILPRIIQNPGESSSSDREPSTGESTRSMRSRPVASTGVKDTLDATHETRNSVGVPNTVESTGATSGEPGGAESAPTVDFITLMPRKSMLKTNTRESFGPIAVMCVLFFLWGFAFGFIDVLNAQFQVAGGYAPQRILQLHATYFSAYVLGPILVARPILKKWGVGATIVTGLAIYSFGTLVFWPAAALISLPTFFISNFIVGLGISVIETAADLFMSLCGPMDHAEMRLNVAQGVQAVGAMISALLAQKVLFKDVIDAPGLIEIQWTYLGMTIAAVLLAVAYNSLHLPDVSQEELKQLADRRRDDFGTAVCGIRVVWVTLALGVLSQFCNIGGQEGLQTKFHLLTKNEPTPNPEVIGFIAIGHTLLAVGRFFAAFAQLFLKPRWILLVLYLGAILFSILSMTMTGYIGIAMALLLFFFSAGIFSITFAICLRGMGGHSITAAAIMATAISGGAPFPVIQDVVAASRGTRYAMCVTVALFSFGAVFPLYLNLVTAAQKQVDPVQNEYLDHSPSGSHHDTPYLLEILRVSR